jgi:DNA-binding MarR family transcriptional regulator
LRYLLKYRNWAVGSELELRLSVHFIHTIDTQLAERVKRYKIKMNIFFYHKMIKFYNDIADALNMLKGIETDLNIKHFSPNELKVFYTIVSREASRGAQCNITDVVNSSGMSRSTVYKTLRKLSDEGIIALDQSPEDKRESLINFS